MCMWWHAVCRAGSVHLAWQAGGVRHPGHPHPAQLPAHQRAHPQHAQDAGEDHGPAVPRALCLGRPHQGGVLPQVSLSSAPKGKTVVLLLHACLLHCSAWGGAALCCAVLCRAVP